MCSCMQSVSLWCDYLNFLREFDPSVNGYTPDGISKMRNLFERAIPAAGFHVTQGNRIWEGYREFEQGILDTIDKADLEVGFIFLILLFTFYSLHSSSMLARFVSEEDSSMR